MRVPATARWLVLCLWLLPRGAVADELELRWGGKIQSDIRFRVQEKRVGDWYNRTVASTGVSRNENIFKLKLNAEYGRLAGVAEVDLVWRAYARELDTLTELSQRSEVDTFRAEPHAVFIDAVGLGLDGLDLRVGFQQVLWGKGDQFNPTNNLNPLDLEDPLLFGERLSNLMVKVDYTVSMPESVMDVLGDVTISGVLVPIFKPGLVPDTAILASVTPDRVPYVDGALRRRLHTEAQYGVTLGIPGPVVIEDPVVHVPDKRLDNMQFSFRVATTVMDHDVALSYYNGRTDLPQPYLNVASYRKLDHPLCHPADPTQCFSTVGPMEVHMGYPRMQVVGLNVAGELDLLGWASKKIHPLGYRLEVGLYFPQAASLAILQDGIPLRKDGEYPYDAHRTPDGGKPLVVTDTPFLKWVLGLDYTFNKHVYMNVMWIHGFPDEYGAGDWITEGWKVQKGGAVADPYALTDCFNKENGDTCAWEYLRPRQGDYLVLGVDLNIIPSKLLLRVFTIWDLVGVYEDRYNEQTGQRERTHHGMFSAEGFSATIYPEINYNFGNGFELGGGALLLLGKDHTRFGDPAAGGHQVFARARFSY